MGTYMLKILLLYSNLGKCPFCKVQNMKFMYFDYMNQAYVFCNIRLKLFLSLNRLLGKRVLQIP